ncbi:hypothetical protein R3P38DRAFT_3346173 [Favolaschia claudopus]|uniref:Uncharacterized protein n=1 Tax=Favolaschia claudopus TaxID=2862362 RepID=A0AAW0D811_9AGAR
MLLPNHEILTLEGRGNCQDSLQGIVRAFRTQAFAWRYQDREPNQPLASVPPPSHLHFTAKNFPSSILCSFHKRADDALTIRIAVRRAALQAHLSHFLHRDLAAGRLTPPPTRTAADSAHAHRHLDVAAVSAAPLLRRHDVATSGERDSLESFGRRQAKARPRSIKQRVPPLALLPPSSGRRAAALLRRHDVATSRERDFSCDVSPSGERTFWIFKYGNSFLASVSWGECCCRRKVNLNFNPRYFDVRRATSPPPIIFSFRCAALKTTTSSDSSSPQELNSSSAARHTRSIFSSAARCRLLQVPPKLPLSRPTQSIQYCPKRQISAANLQDPSPTTFDPSQRSKAAFKRLTSKLQDPQIPT